MKFPESHTPRFFQFDEIESALNKPARKLLDKNHNIFGIIHEEVLREEIFLDLIKVGQSESPEMAEAELVKAFTALSPSKDSQTVLFRLVNNRLVVAYKKTPQFFTYNIEGTVSPLISHNRALLNQVNVSHAASSFIQPLPYDMVLLIAATGGAPLDALDIKRTINLRENLWPITEKIKRLHASGNVAVLSFKR